MSKQFLVVGLACVDIISVCQEFPEEDTDHRCLSQYWARGGNASNSSSVIALLGGSCHFLGTLANSHELQFLLDDFKKYGVQTELCIMHDGMQCPMSIVIINEQNGSRTIIHSNKDLPEVQISDFKKLDLSQFKWIHFEGRRSSDQIKLMLEHIHTYNKTLDKNEKIVTSVELEKTTRQKLEQLRDMADYVFVSKEHAKYHGFHSMADAVKGFCEYAREGATVIVAWGEEGAMARTKSGEEFSSPAFPPAQVVDTLGAGDTFNGATILALGSGKGLGEAIQFGCQVAGTKVGIKGFEGLKGKFTL